jgi:hypothetical protein
VRIHRSTRMYIRITIFSPCQSGSDAGFLRLDLLFSSSASVTSGFFFGRSRIFNQVKTGGPLMTFHHELVAGVRRHGYPLSWGGIRSVLRRR